MERLLHYVWKYKLYTPLPLETIQGDTIEVIDPGSPNSDAGPDFFNAKIKIAGTCWAGCIEIHDKASDWYAHRHDKDKAYDVVILHVVGEDDAIVARTNGEVIPQLVLPIPERVRHNIEWLLQQDRRMPCSDFIPTLDPFFISSWKDTLLTERLERKTGNVYHLLDLYHEDWNEVCYILLTRYFGFGINNDALERLARSLPFRYIQKQRGSQSQVEAMLFGQAGMLEETLPDHYYRLLQNEYRFLQQKFQLKPIDASLFKSFRIRPASFPFLKIAQLAAIWVKHDTLFSILLSGDLAAIREIFMTLPSDYWQTHYHFRHPSPPKEKRISDASINILIINVVVILIFAYGCRTRQIEYCERATSLLEQLPAEKNTIVGTFARYGIPVRNAGDSQSLIQLKREYCEKKKCLFCRIGFQMLKKA